MSDPAWYGRSVRVTTFGMTDVGTKRSHNEDSFLIAELTPNPSMPRFCQDSLNETPAIERPGEFSLGPAGALLMVADGMGGAAAGEVASALAVTTVFERMEDGWVPERARTADRFARHLLQAVEEAHSRIHRRSQRNSRERGMGSTATTVGLFDGYAYLAQVGDSRAYVVRNGTATQLTEDQTVVQNLIDSGTLAEEDAEQSEYRHVILQALGTQASVDVDLTYLPLRRNDVLVLCSDGLSGSVEAEAIVKSIYGTDSPAQACRKLIDQANERGGPDNITVITAHVDGPGLDEPTEEDVVKRKPLVLREP